MVYEKKDFVVRVRAPDGKTIEINGANARGSYAEMIEETLEHMKSDNAVPDCAIRRFRYGYGEVAVYLGRGKGVNFVDTDGWVGKTALVVDMKVEE